MAPYIPSPTSQANRYRKCINHTVASNETLAGIALKYDITVEDIRRTNSGLWTSNSVWVGQVIKIPIILSETSLMSSDTIPEEHQAKQLNKVHGKGKTKGSSKKDQQDQIGPTPSEFWTKMDSSIEETKKASKQYKRSEDSLQRRDKDGNVMC